MSNALNSEELENQNSFEVIDESRQEEEETGRLPDSDPDDLLLENSLRIVYQPHNFLLPHLVNMIRDKSVLNLRPEYQRRNRWNGKQKSKLIESLILNIPIPAIYLYESSFAKYEVMDGQQRLTAIGEYFDNDFKLTGLKQLKRLNNKFYNDLSPKIKRTIDRATLSCLTLLFESESKIQDLELGEKFDMKRLIFERLNTGGTKLNSQEIRNSLYTGPLNGLILDLCRHENFNLAFGFLPYTSEDPEKCENKQQREKRTEYKTMRDCEIILRFFALKEKSEIQGSMLTLLDKALISNIERSSVESEREKFITRFDFLYNLFDRKPFRLEEEVKGKPVVSVNLYDSLMVAINEFWLQRDEIKKDKVGVHQRLHDVLQNPKNYEYLTGKIPGAKSIQKRIKLAREILISKVKK